MWWPFARKGSDVAEQTPTTAKLFGEQAVQQLLGLLMVPEMDAVIQAAGITRSDLAKLETDDEIFQGLRTRRDAVVASPWRFEPGEGNVTEFLIEELKPHIEQLVAHAWKAVAYGYNVQEVIYKQRPDGKIGIDRIVEKPIRWFDPRPDMTLKYMPELNASAQPILVDTKFKFLDTRHDATYENPKGEALLSRLYWPWFFRYNGWRFWSQFLERFGQPLLTGMGRDTKTMAVALVQAHSDAVIAYGIDEKIEVVEPKGEGRSFALYENALIMRIQKLILGQTLTSGTGQSQSGGSGASYSLGVVHNTVRDDLRKADLRMIRKTVQTLVDALCALNFKTRVIPEFLFDDGTGLGKDRAERDKILWGIGVNFTKQYFIDRYDLVDSDFDLDPNARMKTQLIESDNLDTPNDGSAVPPTSPKERVNSGAKSKSSNNNDTGAPKHAPKAAADGGTK